MRNWIDLFENNDPTDVEVRDLSLDGDDELAESAAVETNISDCIFDALRNSEMEPRAINNGHCHEFAEIIVAAMGGTTPDTFAATTRQEADLERHGLTYDPTAPLHCFIVHNGRAYDAEAPDGRDEWQSLPLFTRRVW